MSDWILDELARNYYLLLMLAVGVVMSILGFRWSRQEREEREKKRP